MKKNYVIPQVEVLLMEIEDAILYGSGDDDPNSTTAPGVGNGGEIDWL